MLLAVQFGNDDPTRQSLHHSPSIWLSYIYVAHLLLFGWCSDIVSGFQLSQSIGYRGSCRMAGDLRSVSLRAPAAHLFACHKNVQRHSFRRHRLLYPMALHLHLLGHRLWSELQSAHVLARQIHLHLDIVVYTFLYIFILQLSELYLVL